MQAVRITEPDFVRIPMQMHIGAPCEPLVKAGDRVSVGQTVGDSSASFCTPVHAPISGRVTAIGDITMPNGSVCAAVTVESDGEMRPFEDIAPPKADTREDFLKAVRASGLVGLGGAGFPTHIKLNFPEGRIDTLIVNAAECEPYVTVDYRECIEHAKNLLAGIALVKDFLKIKNVVVAVENNKPEAIRVLAETAAVNNGMEGISVMKLRSFYPQGAEKIIIRSATGRMVPPGKLPSDVGCIVLNVATVAFIARYMRTGRPLVSRTITVDGSAIRNPKNVRVPIGVNISDVIKFCGGFKEEPRKIITGGPMMGLAIISIDLPVLKQNNAILAFSGAGSVMPESACIRCGRCCRACTLRLRPTVIDDLVKIKDIAALEKSGAELCMSCGSCAYVCPAGKPLVQTMQLAKYAIKEARAEGGGSK